MPKTVICLWFDTEAERAAEYYTRIWPDSEVLETVRWGAENPEREGQALTVSWRLGDTEYVGLNGGPQNWGFSEAISFQIMCADQQEVDHYWNALGAGGDGDGLGHPAQALPQVEPTGSPCVVRRDGDAHGSQCAAPTA